MEPRLTIIKSAGVPIFILTLTEFNSRFKQEGNSLFLDAGDMEELKAVVSRQMRYYNTKRRRSSPGYVSPMVYIQSMLSDRKEEN